MNDYVSYVDVDFHHSFDGIAMGNVRYLGPIEIDDFHYRERSMKLSSVNTSTYHVS